MARVSTWHEEQPNLEVETDQELGLLRNDRDSTSKIVQVQLARSHTIIQHLPARWDKPEQTQSERRLPRPGSPDYTDLAARRDRERELVQDLRAVLGVFGCELLYYEFAARWPCCRWFTAWPGDLFMLDVDVFLHTL